MALTRLLASSTSALALPLITRTRALAAVKAVAQFVRVVKAIAMRPAVARLATRFTNAGILPGPSVNTLPRGSPRPPRPGRRVSDSKRTNANNRHAGKMAERRV